jgi:protein-tyrosine-phosphatase
VFEPLRIAFVDANNCVRSPMAKLLFSAEIRQRRLGHLVRVTSAGTFDDNRWGTKYVGVALPAVVARVLHSRWGMTDIRHRAKQLDADDLGADLVVAMDGGHVRTLQRLGVPAERIRLLRSFDPQARTPTPDIACAEFNSEVGARVYDEITSSFPGLHGWVDAQLARTRDVPRAFRMAYTRPAEDPLWLYSPCYSTPVHGIRPTNCRTTDLVLRARCSLQDHEPPAPSCTCGIWAVDNIVDALWRVRKLTRGIRRQDLDVLPMRPDPGIAPILTQVALHRAIESLDLGAGVDGGVPVLRAASAEVERIFVTDELIGTRRATELANRLAASYGVEAIVGLPKFTQDDWDARPEWMRTEPWRSMYRVDSLVGPLKAISLPSARPDVDRLASPETATSAPSGKVFVWDGESVTRGATHGTHPKLPRLTGRASGGRR